MSLGATQQALELAEHGLSLAGEVWTLARCAGYGMPRLKTGETDIALRVAGLRVLAELPAVDDYRALVNSARACYWPTFSVKRSSNNSGSGLRPHRPPLARNLCL